VTEAHIPSKHELLVVAVMRSSEIIQHRVLHVLREFEITNSQYNILRILRGAKTALTVGEVKERMLVETSDVSRLLDRLVKKGLVNRDVCPDNRRKMDVSISKIGLKILFQLDTDISNGLDGFYSSEITLEEAEKALEILSKID
jgi:DNA-binding MarR family transcriptional regulator